MALEQLTIHTLGNLDDAKTGVAFATHLKRAADDCYDRPVDNRPRKVTIQIELVPVPEANGDCGEVNADVKITSTIPPHQTKTLSLGLRHNGMLVHRTESPHNVNQPGLPIADDEE